MPPPEMKVVTGLNHNLRHNGVLYHVQTEDLGRENPQVVTQAFLDGAVLATLKSSYADRLDEGDYFPLVRKMMESQHKQMLKKIAQGLFDPTKEAVVEEEDVFAEDMPLEDVLKAYFEGMKK